MDRRSMLIAPLGLMAASAQAARPNAAIAPENALLAHVAPGLRGPDGFIDLWPQGQMPIAATASFAELVEDVSKKKGVLLRRVKGVSRPRMAVFRPAKPTGQAVLICPGGGFSFAYFDHEGHDLARALAAHGITAFVLFYRLGNDGWERKPEVGSVDAQRALNLIGARAKDFGIDPTRIGILGFSAGGFVAMNAANWHVAARVPPVDAADARLVRPAFVGGVYGVLSLDPAIVWGGAHKSLFGRAPTDEEMAAYSPDRTLSANTPPVFLVHAEDDKAVPVDNALRVRAAALAHGVPVETHLYPTGGHGFGMQGLLTKGNIGWAQNLVRYVHQLG